MAGGPVALEAAKTLLRVDEPARALELYRARPVPRDGIRALDERVGEARALVGLGRPEQALALARPARDAHGPHDDADLVIAETLLLLRRPQAALDHLGAYAQADWAPTPAQEPAALDRALLRARAYTAQVRYEEATRLLTNSAEGASTDELRAKAFVALAWVQLWTGGNLRDAALSADQMSRCQVPRDSDLWLETRLVNVELLGRRDPREAARLVERLRADIAGQSVPTRLRVRLALYGLAQGGSAFVEHVAHLLDALQSISSEEARIVMLRGLRRVRVFERLNGHLRDRFQREVLSLGLRLALVDTRWPEDRGYLRLLLTEAARLMDMPVLARRLIDAATQDLAASESPLLMERLTRLRRIDPAYVAPDRVAELPDADRYPLLNADYLVELARQPYPAELVDVQRGRLDSAQRIYDAYTGPRLAGEARLHEGWAACEAAAGDSKAAYRAAGVAASVWFELGDVAAMERVLRAADLSEQPPPVPERGVPVRLDDVVPGRDGVLDGARTIAQLQDPQLWGDAVWADQPWLYAALAQATPKNRIDLALVADSPSVAAVPWELARVDGRPVASHAGVRYLYRASADANRQATAVLQRILKRLGMLTGRADGVFGPDTTEDVRRFQRDHDLFASGVPDRLTWEALRTQLRSAIGADPHVLIVRAEADQSSRFEEGRAIDAETVYQGFGVRTSSLIDPSPEALLEYGQRLGGSAQPIGAVHFCGNLNTARRSPMLYFYSPPGAAEPIREPLAASVIDEFVRCLTGVVPPLVILDIAAPATAHETARQLLLRNEFAHQLMQLGATWTLIASGLAGGTLRTTQLEHLAAVFRPGADVAAVCARLQASATHRDATLAAQLAFTATALFTAIPPDALIEPAPR
jgi:peptidoglycan hydrolase-like protein with peptidoglycan-binding domain